MNEEPCGFTEIPEASLGKALSTTTFVAATVTHCFGISATTDTQIGFGTPKLKSGSPIADYKVSGRREMTDSSSADRGKGLTEPVFDEEWAEKYVLKSPSKPNVPSVKAKVLKPSRRVFMPSPDEMAHIESLY